MATTTAKKEQLKIAMVSPTLGSAFGMEQVLMTSVGGLRAQGHEVTLIGESAHDSLTQTEKPFLIPSLFSTPALMAPKLLTRVMNQFKSTLETIKPDLIHFLDQPHADIIDFATEHYPCILTAHTVAPTCPASHRLINESSVCHEKSGWSCLLRNKTTSCLSGFKSDIHRAHALYEFQTKKKATQKMKAIVAISRYVESTLLENGFSREQVKLIYNPIPTFQMQSREFSRTNLIVSACRLVPLKGIEYAIRALKLIESLDWEYWILGEGPLQVSLSALVKELKLENRVLFKGKKPREETLQIIQSAKVFLQPNIGPEGFGLSIAEALSLGVPAVAFDTPALDEIVDNNKTGYLVESKDTEGLSRAISDLLTDPQKHSQFSQTGRNETTNRFSESLFLEKTLQVYQDIVT
jgi:glycosyltransferase involved in cell wall biosynthesis